MASDRRKHGTGQRPQHAVMFACLLGTTCLVIQRIWETKSSSVKHSAGCKEGIATAAEEAAATVPVPGSPLWAAQGGFSVSTCNSEGDSELCKYCNATFSRRHPLSLSDYERSFHPGQHGSIPPWLLDRLLSGTPVTIAAVGGSETYGGHCIDGNRTHHQCAWLERLRDRLLQLYPQAIINARNMARPSFYYKSFLESGAMEQLLNTDVLLVDLQVNSQTYGFDVHTQMEEVDEFLSTLLELSRLQQCQLGIMFVETFRTCSIHTRDCDGHCPKHRQGSMTYNVTVGHTGRATCGWQPGLWCRVTPGAALPETTGHLQGYSSSGSNSSDGTTKTFTWCNRWWTMATFERPIVQHYGLPIASYRDAVWPQLSQPPARLPCSWNGMSHLDALGHILIGDVVAYGLLQAAYMERTAAGPSKNAVTAKPLRTTFFNRSVRKRYCTNSSAAAQPPGTFMGASDAAGFAPLHRTGCWRWWEDRPGKPGWICEVTTEAAAAGSNSSAAEAGRPANCTTAAPTAQQAASCWADTLWFKVVFSSTPQLQLTYLTTYDNIGSATLMLFNSTGTQALPDPTTTPVSSTIVNARIQEKFSVPRTTFWVAPASRAAWPNHPHVHQLPDSIAAGEYLVAIWPVLPDTAATRSKFKLLGLSSC